jgi:hypothetical protein
MGDGGIVQSGGAAVRDNEANEPANILLAACGLAGRSSDFSPKSLTSGSHSPLLASSFNGIRT